MLTECSGGGSEPCQSSRWLSQRLRDWDLNICWIFFFLALFLFLFLFF